MTNKQHEKNLRKYLKNQAEPEVHLLDTFNVRFQHCLVVPFYREPAAALLRHTAAIDRQGNTLLIAVSNRPETDGSTEWHRELFKDLGDTPAWHSDDQVLALFPTRNHSAVLVVDRVIAGAPIAGEQGVGLARKIGADIACQLIASQHIASPWIGNTDADAYLPDDYFEVQCLQPETAALVYPFQTLFVDNRPRLPSLLYDFSLHYYVEGLRWAGSPYAYHSIGSTLAVRWQNYVQVRGFPKRSGAEDFYILSKLAKTGAVKSLNSPLVKLEARHSDRVPFGTGPATARLAQMPDPLNMPLYHPAGFTYLKAWLELLRQLATAPQPYSPLLEVVTREQSADLDPDQLQRCGKALKLDAALAHCYQQGRDATSRLRHLHAWFDGFKTLKLIHLLRDQSLGTIPFRQWREQNLTWGQTGSEPMQRIQAEIEWLTCTPAPSGE